MSPGGRACFSRAASEVERNRLLCCDGVLYFYITGTGLTIWLDFFYTVLEHLYSTWPDGPRYELASL